MIAAPLRPMTVLLTRPQHQAEALHDAITAAGGTAIRFPVMDIVPRAAAAIAADLRALPAADIVIFVSPNAVQQGLQAAAKGASVAAIGTSTAAALAAAGLENVLVPAQGFNSEALLAEDLLQQVAGKRVRIVRGQDGRELLGATLSARGARVDYLAVYARRRHEPEPAELEQLETAWRTGGIDYVLAMSVASLEFLLELLPTRCRQALPRSVLVTPSERVLKTAQELIPGMRALLAASPDAGDLVKVMLADQNGPMDDTDE